MINSWSYRAASAHCVYWRRVTFLSSSRTSPRVPAHTSRFSIVALVPSRVLILILSTLIGCNGHGNSALTFSFRRNRKALKGASSLLMVYASTAGGRRAFEAELVVHGAGRVPEIDDLNLSAARVQYDERGVQVNEFLRASQTPQSTQRGDAAASGGPHLTPVAGYEGEIVAGNLLEGNHRKPNYLAVPTVVFTVPPLAGVGLLEQPAREQGLRFRTNHQDTSRWYSSRRVERSALASRSWSKKAAIKFSVLTWSVRKRVKSSTFSRWLSDPEWQLLT